MVDRDVALLGEKTGHVQYVQTDKRSVDVIGFIVVRDLLNDFDAVEFVAVYRSSQKDCRSRLLTVDDCDRNLERIVVPTAYLNCVFSPGETVWSPTSSDWWVSSVMGHLSVRRWCVPVVRAAGSDGR